MNPFIMVSPELLASVIFLIAIIVSIMHLIDGALKKGYKKGHLISLAFLVLAISTLLLLSCCSNPSDQDKEIVDLDVSSGCLQYELSLPTAEQLEFWAATGNKGRYVSKITKIRPNFFALYWMETNNLHLSYREVALDSSDFIQAAEREIVIYYQQVGGTYYTILAGIDFPKK